MFGKQDDKPAQETADADPDKSASGEPVSEDRESGQPASQPSEPDSTASASVVKPDPDDSSAPEPDKTAGQASGPPPVDDHDEQPAWQHPGTPLSDENEHEQISDIISPAGGYPKRPSYQYITAGAGPGGSAGLADDDPAVHELIDIKQQALGELSPLVDQLDLPPEEKFHAIMMVIQASDDKELVKAAYATAHSIEDEKIRAQALLDLVNEINYFTQPPEPVPEASQ